jgi:hypothetical protein
MIIIQLFFVKRRMGWRLACCSYSFAGSTRDNGQKKEPVEQWKYIIKTFNQFFMIRLLDLLMRIGYFNYFFAGINRVKPKYKAGAMGQLQCRCCK